MAAHLFNKAGWVAAGVLALLLIAALAGVVLGGPLDPPGAPGSTGKTLQEVEPRVPIDSLPFDITQPGSYYLTRSITCSGCGDGILIDANDVTVDLNGFTISGGTGSGVSVVSSRSNVAVRNGAVDNWGGSGINFQTAQEGMITGVRVSNTLMDGIVLGNAVTLTDCRADYSSVNGIKAAGDGSMISGCGADGNLNGGILLSGTNNHASGNTLSSNTGNGLAINGMYDVAQDNVSASNGAYGFLTNGTYNQVFRNTARHNGTNFNSSSPLNDVAPVSTALAVTSPAANISD